MCQKTNSVSGEEDKKFPSSRTQTQASQAPMSPTSSQGRKKNAGRKGKERRPKREKQSQLMIRKKRSIAKRKLQSRHQQRNKQENSEGHDSGGIMALLPSLGLLFVGAFAVMAKMGFRGRPTTAGIDLGTTNSVICVQSPSKSVGTIECIRDPFTDSPIIPSVVSFLDKPIKLPANNKIKTPATVIVGEQAKRLIDTHPKSTFYHSKRVIGRSYKDPAITELRHEVQFQIEANEKIDNSESNNSNNLESEILFHSPESGYKTPTQISSYVLTFLLDIASQYSSSYSALSSAVIAIPAEFSMNQRIATIQAFTEAGIKVTRVLEEPAAAALAYGLDQKEGVEHILVYDFGGGTLDVSILRVSPDGFVDVLGSAGDSNLGGVDFDTKVADYLLSKRETPILRLDHDDMDAESKKRAIYAEQKLEQCGMQLNLHVCTESGIRSMAEMMKIGLSNLYDPDKQQDEVFVEETCLTNDAATTESINTKNRKNEDVCSLFPTHTIRLTAAEYDNAVADLYPRSILPVKNALEDLNMKREEIDEVVMVGGTTRMPQIRELVKKEFTGVIEQLNTEIDPDLTVAYGAASVID